jgi:WD40 repeat protein/regulator of sirC expression with transglutaminase-like and TPR domain
MNPKANSMNPFPGLRPFRQDEDYLFFGREEQTMELLQRLGYHRFVAVVGTSGSGKSSLVRCGLLSELLGGKLLRAGTSWEVAVTHPGGNPLALLAEALLDAELYDRGQEHAREHLLATLSRSNFGLVEAIKQARLPGGTNFLLVVDQFEEIFRFNEAGQMQQEVANEFVSMLLEAVAQTDVPIYIVLTMRSDFIGDCGQFERLAETVNRGEFLIPRLSRDQFKRIIEAPVKVAGGQITSRLLQRLLNDLGQQTDQLPCLQHALMRTWSVWSSGGETEALDLDDYQRIGRMSEALSQHADEVFDSLANDRQRELCAGMFKALTVQESDNRGIRRPQRLGVLCQILEVPVDELRPVIDAFRQQSVTFLMPSPEVELTDRTIIDISHESLMRVWIRLRRWVEDEAQAVGIYRRLSESAALNEQGKAGLYRDPELGIALAWREAARPNQAWATRYDPGFARAMAFLDASQQARIGEDRAQEAARQHELEQARVLAESERQRAETKARAARRLRMLLAGTAAIALFAVGASIVAFNFWRDAERAKQAAELSEQTANLNAKAAKSEAERAAAQEAAAEEARQQAVAARESEAGQRARAEGALYASRITLAENAVNVDDGAAMVQVLQKSVPAAGSTDRRGWEWYYFDRIASTALRSFSDHSTPFVYAIAISPDGRLLASAGGGNPYFDNPNEHVRPGEVIIRDLATGNTIRTIRGHKHQVTSVAFGSDGKQLATGGFDGTIRIWNVESGKLERSMDNFPFVRGVEFVPDQNWLAIDWISGGRDPATNKPIDIHHLELRDLESGTTIKSPFAAKFAYDHNSRRMFLSDRERGFSIRVVDPDTWEEIALLPGDNLPLDRMVLDPGGRYLAVCVRPDLLSAADQVRVYDTETGTVRHRLLHRQGVRSLAFSPDGKVLATGGSDPVVRLWDMNTGRQVAVLFGHENFVSDLKFTPDGSRLISSDFSGNVKEWDPRQNPRQSPIATGHAYETMWSLTFADNGSTIRTVASSNQRAVFEQWDSTTGKKLNSREVDSTTARVWPRNDYAFSRDGRLAVGPTESDKGAAAVWDLDAGKPVASLVGHRDPIQAVAFSNDAALVATVAAPRMGSASEFIIWNASNGTQKTKVDLGQVAGMAIAFSPDAKTLAVATRGKDGPSVAVWDILNSRQVQTLTGDDLSEIRGLAYSPDGKQIAGADYLGGLVHVWDVVSGEKKFTLAAAQTTCCVAYSPDGRRLAAVAYDSNVHLWDSETGQEVAILRPDVPAVGSIGLTPKVAFSSDGSKIAVNSWTGMVTVWDAGDKWATISLADSIQRDPENLQLLQTRAERSRNAELWQDMAGDYGRLTRLKPENASAWLGLASANVKLGLHSEAMANLRRVLELEPDNPDAVFERAALNADGGNQNAAIADYMKYSRLRSDDDARAGGFAEKLLKNTVTWTVLDPSEMKSAGGSILTKLPDGLILCSGENPDTDSITITAPVPAGVTGLKLEVVPHASLPAGGSGRDPQGVFLLSELSAAIVPPGEKRQSVPVRFRAATTDYAFRGFAIEQVWDGNPGTGWIVYGQANKPHFAIFEFAKPAGEDEDSNLTIRLHCTHPSAKKATLGCFRLAATTTLHPLAASRIVERLRQTLNPRTSLATALYLAGDSDAACALVQNQAAHQSGDNVNTLLLAAIESERGESNEASRLAERVQSSLDSDGEDDAFASLIVQATMRALAKSDERNFPLLALRARGYATLHDTDRAISDYTKVLEMNPNNSRALTARARVHAEIKQYEEAAADFTAAITQNPNDLSLYAQRAEMLARLKRWEQSAADFDRAIAGEPQATNSWFAQGPHRRRIAADGELFDYVAAVRPDDRELWIARVNYLASRGEWKSAAVAARRVVELNPDDHWSWFSEAPLRLKLDDIDGYRQVCQEMLARFAETDDLVIAERTAKTCFLAPDAVENLQIPQKLCEKTITNGAEHSAIRWFNLAAGISRFRCGELPEAIEQLEKSLTPAHAVLYLDAAAHVVLAMTHHRLGHAQQANESLTRARELMKRMPGLMDARLRADWADWLRVQILFKEAETLLGSNAKDAASESEAVNKPAGK